MADVQLVYTEAFCTTMDELKSWFTDALPDLTEDRVISVIAELAINGCRTVGDLEFVDCDADLGQVLLPVE